MVKNLQTQGLVGEEWTTQGLVGEDLTTQGLVGEELYIVPLLYFFASDLTFSVMKCVAENDTLNGENHIHTNIILLMWTPKYSIYTLRFYHINVYNSSILNEKKCI